MDANFVLHTSHLKKHFGSVRAVEDVSLDVQRGEIFGFLGPNGAGKTTTISMKHVHNHTHQEAAKPSELGGLLSRVLAVRNNKLGIVSKNADGAVIVIVPIRGEDNRVDGALIENTGPNIYSQEAFYWFEFDSVYNLISVVVYTFFALIVSMISSGFTARTITRRFNILATAADNWSQGNFSEFVQDTSPDELGQLSQKLNRMAEQLKNLMRTRQQLAILEERNRLARDLHDSVKQHLFVVALQVGTAKLCLDHGQEVVEARQRLSEAERVLHQVQEELRTLIRELRLVALESKGLRPALQELVAQWKDQNAIPTSLQVDSKDVLPLLVEEALFRVVQEALSNVARHSNTIAVQVQLVSEADRVTLTIDDNGQGFDTFLEVYPDFSMIGEADSGEAIVRLVDEHVPDVVLMDLVMAGIGGVEATRLVKRASLHTQVIVLTSYDDDEYIFPALRAGALSYILKDVSIDELAETIRKAARGESVLHPRVAARIVQEIHRERRDIPSLFTELSTRELEVLRLIADGLSNAAIAAKLVISEKTVKVHVSNILSKLHILDRTQAAVFAWQQGLVHRDHP